jgi:hypothetical protein
MSRSTPPGGARARRSVAHQIPPFDGYPYLVTRIGHSALRHVAILPATWSRERLLGLAHRQVLANQLDTCLVLGPGDAVYVTTDGGVYRGAHVPTGLPVVERLRLAEHLRRTSGMAARRARLRAYGDAHRGRGYLVGDGLEGGRLATREDLIRLVGLDGEVSPVGLARCPTCGELAGDYLATKGEGNGDRRPRVIHVHCQCENHNRCARCGGPLAERRLSAYHFVEDTGSVCYVAAYCAFSHRCRRIRGIDDPADQSLCRDAPGDADGRRRRPSGKPGARRNNGSKASRPCSSSLPSGRRSARQCRDILWTTARQTG